MLIEAFADWEAAHLAAALRGWFDGAVHHATPGGAPVTSMGGLQIVADGAIEDLRAEDYDGLVLVGSPHWEGPKAPFVGAVLADAHAAERVIGAICGATLAVARAGLLDSCRHTSNSLSYLQQNAAAYRGAEHFDHGPRAVRDGHIVTAPGSAPVSFATAVLEGLLPRQAPAIAEFAALCAREHHDAAERQPIKSARVA